MKRYMVFAGGNGKNSEAGWDAFVGDFDNVVEADAKGEREAKETGWYEIVDSTTGERGVTP